MQDPTPSPADARGASDASASSARGAFRFAAPEGGAERMSGMVDCVEAAGFIFFSAIRGRRPGGTDFADGVEAQARQAFGNLERSLRGINLTLLDVVKVTVYLGDLRSRGEFHNVWCELFGDSPPARTVVKVDDPNAAPGGGALFVMDVVAHRPA